MHFMFMKDTDYAFKISKIMDLTGNNVLCGSQCITSLAMVVMKAGGRAVAMRERAWRAERAESAGGLRGKPIVIL